MTYTTPLGLLPGHAMSRTGGATALELSHQLLAVATDSTSTRSSKGSPGGISWLPLG
jgi:hypothetical protein